MSKKKLRVEKIGGTSMTIFDKIVDTIILKNKKDITHRVYVVSAYGGITNELLEHKKTKKPGIYTQFEKNSNFCAGLETLKKKLFKINKGFVGAGLDLKAANEFISDRIDIAVDILKSMNAVLASGYLKRAEVLLSAREMLASLGEMHSAFNSANIVQSRGYDATFVDLSGWKDGRELTIDERIKEVFSTIDPSKTICFVTGYTKGTEGIMREFDRGYSEVTFSKIAVNLKAKEAVIHKEFHLCSGDPAILGEDHVKPVCQTNFDVADQLADVDMEAIHPKASKPLEKAGINIRLKNAFEPDHQGTLISEDFICPESKIEVVTGSDHVTSIGIHDTRMVGEVGFDLMIMEFLATHHVSYVSKVTNANTIELVIKDKDLSRALIKDLKDNFEMVTIIKAAIVCAIGSNIAKPGVLATAARSLAEAGINILSVAQTSRQTNMQFLVMREEFINAQKALHTALCEDMNL